MNYYIDLFSPETAQAFSNSERDISGFRVSRKSYIENQGIKAGDRFICYVTRVQRFIGVLEVVGDYFIEETPIFTSSDDPFILRFKVKPLVWLPLEKAIPIHNDLIWNKLSFTKKHHKDSNRWTFMVFSSPRLWPKADCQYIEKILFDLSKKEKEFPFSDEDLKKLKLNKIRVSDEKEVTVSIPEEEAEEEEVRLNAKVNKVGRNSHEVQAKLAEIGDKLGFKIWLPANDKSRVLDILAEKSNQIGFLKELPLVFDETTLKTIRNIDVLWIKNRSIFRAFEVEDTTSIYSGILRMADLLALQPMLNIKAHIVAPSERRDAVFKQITRPVFALMGDRSLSEVCSYLSYDSIEEISKERMLKHMTDSILDEFTEYSE